MGSDPEVSVVICSPVMVCATALLNGNAFPEIVKSEATAAARRLAVLLGNAAALPTGIDQSATAFLTHLQRNWAAYASAARSRADLHVVAYSDGLHYMSDLHGVLYEFKAFLDLYTRLLCKLITPGSSPAGFNKGKINGVELSGGRFAKWVDAKSIKEVPRKQELFEYIVTTSREWITPAVAFRDIVGHFSDLPGFRHMRVSLTDGQASVTLSDILRPEMPNGRGLDQYALDLCARLGQFVGTTIRLVPGVIETLLEPWEHASRYLQE